MSIVSKVSMKKVMLINSDPRNINRMVNHISWQTDGQEKIAVSYSNLDFHSHFIHDRVDSLLWNIGTDRRNDSLTDFPSLENPNQPELILQSNSPLTTVEFNPKDNQQILGGCLNGQVCS